MQVTIESGFARLGAGDWLVSRSQPVAFRSALRRLHRRGWNVRDRSHLERIETNGDALFADSDRPFLTHIPCAAPINAVSSKVLVAPSGSWAGADVLRVIPMSVSGAFPVSHFALAGDATHQTSQNSQTFVIMATKGRTMRMPLEEGETLSIRPEALVAWTGNKPTGFCPKLGIMDLLLPRGPKDLLLNFYGPGIVWLEGSRQKQGRMGTMRERRVW